MANLSTIFSVAQAKADLQAILHGTTLNQVQGVNNIFNRTARQLLLDCDPQETMRKALTPPIFDKVFDYSIENLLDIKGNRITDVRPQVNRNLIDVFHQTYGVEFDTQKSFTVVDNLTFAFDAATKSIRIDATNLQTGVLLNGATTITGNGTWVIGGGATNLANDTVYFVENGGAIRFDVVNGAYVENSTMTSVNLTNHLTTASEFIWIYFNNATDAGKCTSIGLKWGSSSSAYYSSSVTANFDGSAFHAGWNQIQIDWQGLTPTGSPIITAYNYLRLSFMTSGAITGIRVNSFWSRLPAIYEILYYSKYLFRDVSTQAFRETVTDDSNLINLDTETFPIFFNLLAYYTLQQVGGEHAQADMNFYLQEYGRGIKRYNDLYKSQVLKPKQTYYQMPKPGYQRFLGRKWF